MTSALMRCLRHDGILDSVRHGHVNLLSKRQLYDMRMVTRGLIIVTPTYKATGATFSNGTKYAFEHSLH